MASELQGASNYAPVVTPAADVTGGMRPEVVVAGFAASVSAASEVAEDVASANGDVGTRILVLQVAAAGDLAANGDYAYPQMSGGRLLTATDTELPAAAALGDATANPTVPAVGAFGMLWNGASWDRAQADTDKNLKVVIPAGSATGTKAEDAASASGDTGVPAMAIRQATPANTSSLDGDYEMLRISEGRLWVSPDAAGDVAHDAADSGYPVKIGARAVNSEPTAVANGDRVNLIADLVGKLLVLPYANPENVFSGASASDITGTTSTQVIAAHGSLRRYITSISVSNMHATVGTRVDILDGNGGTVLWSGAAAAAGGGYTITFPVPLRCTAATRIDAQCGTTGAAVRVAIAGYNGV